MMGSFVGHAVPGAFFICFAVWCMIQTYRRYFRSLSNNSSPFVATVHFPVVIRGRRVALDAILLVVTATLGIPGETARDHLVGISNFVHATIYLCFGLVGAVGLILPKLNLFPNREDIEYIFLLMAYSAEAVLFTFHIDGRQKLSMHVHTFLIYSIYGCILAVFAEMRFRQNVLGPLARAFFSFLQGTWLWHISFVLYNPAKGMAWGEIDGNYGTLTEDHAYFMLVTCSFIWHMTAILVLMTVTGALIGRWYRRRHPYSAALVAEVENGRSGEEGYALLEHNNIEDASDMKLEFV